MCSCIKNNFYFSDDPRSLSTPISFTNPDPNNFNPNNFDPNNFNPNNFDPNNFDPNNFNPNNFNPVNPNNFNPNNFNPNNFNPNNFNSNNFNPNNSIIDNQNTSFRDCGKNQCCIYFVTQNDTFGIYPSTKEYYIKHFRLRPVLDAECRNSPFTGLAADDIYGYYREY